MANEIQVTQEGYEKLKNELENLKGPVRMQIADAIREAKSHGDLRENAAYHEAKLNQQRLDKRISELERAVQMAHIIERPDVASDEAHLGSTVVLLDIDFDEELTLKLVGSFESDDELETISITSPLGAEIVGKKPGDEFQVSAPAGVTKYRVLSVTS